MTNGSIRKLGAVSREPTTLLYDLLDTQQRRFQPGGRHVRVTLLGHASVLVEMAGTVCLMDPVFFDPFEEGAVVSCPASVVHPDQLPPIDLLVVSHRFDCPLRAIIAGGRGHHAYQIQEPQLIETDAILNPKTSVHPEAEELRHELFPLPHLSV